MVRVSKFVDFERFWDAFPAPLREDKVHARSAYKRARRKASASQLLNAVRKFKWPPDMRPAAWLNDERWLDAPADGQVGEVALHHSAQVGSPLLRELRELCSVADMISALVWARTCVPYPSDSHEALVNAINRARCVWVPGHHVPSEPGDPDPRVVALQEWLGEQREHHGWVFNMRDSQLSDMLAVADLAAISHDLREKFAAEPETGDA